MRLDRFVSQALGVSRSLARQVIRRGEIRVDGRVAVDTGRVLTVPAEVTHAGRRLDLPRPRYLMLHKPPGLVTATRDARQATVMSLLPVTLAQCLHPVGRLDKDTSGLLLLTDDGAWSHRVTSPRHACSKTYLAELAAPLADDAEYRLAGGLPLRGEARPARPATIERLADTRIRITVSEGRYHLVRRLFAALGNRVLALHRERIGGLALDAGLAPGQWRALSERERASVLGEAGLD